jgi:hypothetical protein
MTHDPSSTIRTDEGRRLLDALEAASDDTERSNLLFRATPIARAFAMTTLGWRKNCRDFWRLYQTKEAAIDSFTKSLEDASNDAARNTIIETERARGPHDEWTSGAAMVDEWLWRWRATSSDWHKRYLRQLSAS